MMINGRPYSNENGYEDKALITDRPKEQVELVCAWIRKNIRSRKTPMLERTSYGLKHDFEHDTGLYLTNNEFKDAMLLCGYYPVDPNKLNWCYCISKRSPVFMR